jgi:hypothetical protein
MAQSQRKQHHHSTIVDHRFVAFPARSAAHDPPEVQEQSSSPEGSDPKVGVRRLIAIRGVVVLEVAGRLSDVVEALDEEIEMALAEGPRGVVCEMSGVLEAGEPGAVEMLATAGRHVRDWSGIPVAVACPDPEIREALFAQRIGGHLIVTESMFSAVSLVLMTPSLAVERVRLAPHPTAPRASRDFVARTLLDWGFNALIPSASLVISELVSNSTMGATRDIEVSIAWNLRALRLTVRDNSPDLERQLFTKFDQRGRRLSAVADLARSFGVLPTADGGKVVWAVLNASRPKDLV